MTLKQESFINDKLVDETIDISSYSKEDIYKTFSEINDCHNLVSEYLPFLEAEKLYHTYKSDLKGIERWIEYCLTIKPDNIPYDPWNYYKSEFPFLNIFEDPNYFDDINIEKTNIFLEKVKSHKDYENYNYKYVKYVRNIDNIVLICKEHGVFFQNTCSHKQGHGCYICGREKVIKAHSTISKEVCELEALKYNTKKEFSEMADSIYQKALKISKNDPEWYDNITKHMIPLGNLFNRLIYSYEFEEDKSVYIGLTCDPHIRNIRHNTKGTIYKKKQTSEYEPHHILLTNFMYYKDAQEMEETYLNTYKNSGWSILNKIKTGGLGGNILKWTYDKCKEESLKYTHFTNFSSEQPGALASIRKNGWYGELCSHFIYRDTWTIESCREEALKYTTRTIFQKNSNGAYKFAYRNNWLDDICSHMQNIKKPNGYLTYERCKEIADKYVYLKDFTKENKSVINKIYKMGWSEICNHLLKNKNGYR